MLSLVVKEGAHLLAATGLPVAIAACVAAWAAALGGATPAAGSPLALPGASALLVAAVLEAAALCVAWERAQGAAGRYAAGWQTLLARGASRVQVTVLLTFTGLPLAAGGLLSGAVAGTAARAGAWALLRVAPARHAPVLLLGMAGGLGVAACAAVGVAAAVLGRPRHHRQAGGTWSTRIPFDVGLLILGGYIGLGTLHLALASAAAAAGGGRPQVAGAFGGGSPAAMPPPAFPEWIAAVGGALLLWGGAMFAGRVLSWAISAGLAAIQPRLATSPLLAARAVARSARPLRLVLVPALATAALAYMVAGVGGANRTDYHLRTVQVGGDLQIRVSWPPCYVCPLPPGSVPAVTGLGQGVAGAAAVAPLMDTPGAVATVAGVVRTTVIGVPPGFDAVAVWPNGVDGARLTAALAASPYAAVVSTSLARQLNLAVGDRLAIAGLGYFTVGGTSTVWPVDGRPGGDWVAVPWLLFSRGLVGANAYVSSGLTTTVLVRPRPGASPAAIAAAVQTQAQVAWLQLLLADPLSRGALTADQISSASGDGKVAPFLASAYPKLESGQIQAVVSTEPTVSRVLTRALPPGASHRVPQALVPLATAALMLLALGVSTSPGGDDGLPAGDALAAIGAAGETARARRGLRHFCAWAGVATGVGGGVAAAALYWPSLLLVAPAGVVYVDFRAVWEPLWAAAIVAVVLAASAAVWTARRGVADPVVAARLAARPVFGEPPPSPKSVLSLRLGRLFGALVNWSDLALRPGRAGAAVLVLVVRRLLAARGRVAALAGGLLLAGTVAAAVPLFAEGAMTRVLRSSQLQTTADRPAGAVMVTYAPPPGPVPPAILTTMRSIAADAGRDAGLRATSPVAYLQSELMLAAPAGAPSAEDAGFLSMDSLPDLAAHATWLRGTPPAAEPEADGTIDAAATESTMAGQDAGPFRLGTVYVLTPPGGGRPIRVRITGVFAERDPGGAYWPYRYFQQDVFVAPAMLKNLAFGQKAVTLQVASWYTVLDFGSLAADRVPAVRRGLQTLSVAAVDASRDARVAVSPAPALRRFVDQEQALVSLLRFASLPVLGLVLYFVAITAGVVVDAEAGEISSHASRGASLGQLLGIYLAEWCLLALPLTATAVPLGALFARVIGASAGFLRFSKAAGALPVIWEARDFGYAGAAALLAVGAALVPVLAAARRSIVETRSRASRVPTAPFWQRAYLDVAALILLAVIWTALRGGGAGLVGPAAIYVLPAIFLIAVGLLAVRALGALLRLLDRRVGDRAPLALTLPLRRVGRLPAQYAPLLVLLCLTAALGTFSASAARTLQTNLAAEVHFTVGADLRLVETSPCSIIPHMPPFLRPPPVCSRYGPAYGPHTEPPRALPPFRLNATEPGVAAASDMLQLPVTVDPGVHGIAATLVLIDPATYAQVAWWGPRLDPEPEDAYLSLLREKPNAVFISPDLSGRLPSSANLVVQVPGGGTAAVGRLGVVPRWPGADVNGSMVLATPAVEGALGVACPVLVMPAHALRLPTPTKYCPGSRVALLRLASRARPSAIEAGLTTAGLAITRSDLASAEVQAAERSPQWAGQSGMLSVGFLVALAVAAVGYLFYAWLSLHGQVPQLGLLRAMGVHRRVLVHAVAVEQGMLVTAGALTGVLAGIVASLLFVPLYQPEFTGSGGPPFIAAGPGPALAGLVALLVGLLALALGSLLALLRRLHIGETVKIEL